MKRKIRFTTETAMVQYKDMVIDVIADFYDLSRETILSKTQRKPYPFCRQIYCYFMRKNTECSYKEISALIGKDHATALDAFRKMKGFIEMYPYIHAEIDQISQSIDKVRISTKSGCVTTRAIDAFNRLKNEKENLSWPDFYLGFSIGARNENITTP